MVMHYRDTEVLIDEALLHVCGVSVESLKSLGFKDHLAVEEVRHLMKRICT